MADYPTCRFAGVQSVITKSSRAKKHYEDMLIRNVLRRMQTNPSAQERPKNLLHELKQVDGSEVLMTQDDWDITCGVVIQTRVQKLAFEQ
ncbi:hypothetical protein PC117_g5734 [Phytophthora cactorum]|uniref:Uncharacterized protein n=2 Tax=Phytophthora cactorum TaxID=29920 RepID=A0A8T1E3F8_9STRA|nr:hypothetical protein PC117_g5734 [Phytophthora cactorum]